MSPGYLPLAILPFLISYEVGDQKGSLVERLSSNEGKKFSSLAKPRESFHVNGCVESLAWRNSLGFDEVERLPVVRELADT